MFKKAVNQIYTSPESMNRFLFHLLVLPAIILLTTTCITPLDVEPSDFDNTLVVQGFINDDFGPHDFRITRVAKFAGTRDGGSVRIIENAKVRIIDQNNEAISLERVSAFRKEFRPGCTTGFVTVTTDYRTPETFRGELGSIYTLEIITKDGEMYRSEAQTMVPTPPIDSLRLEFKVLPSLDQIVPESGVEVFASWQDPLEEENFYFWRVNGIYKIFTPDRSDGIFCCPYDPIDGGAKDCWIVEKNLLGNELAFSDEQVNGRRVTLPVGLIMDNGLRFADRIFTPRDKLYYVQVEQYMIPLEAFKFNRRINTLTEINGEIFDPPPLNIRGNIFNVNNPEETVIGYFGAYAKQEKGIFISRSLLEFTQRDRLPCGDCRTRGGAQTEIPEPYK